MAFFLIVTAIYVASLILYRPAPESLKGNQISIIDNIKEIKATLLAGVFLLLIFLLTTEYSFKEVDPDLYKLLGLNNIKDAAILWPMQIFTHLFIHASPYHLLSNVICIGLSSLYERRVGSKRYLAVLAVGAFASVPSILFYAEPIIVCGISGGVFALAAAFFTDHENLSLKEWLAAILWFIIIAVILSFEGNSKAVGKENVDFQVDYWGHLLGAIGGIAYCRIFVAKK